VLQQFQNGVQLDLRVKLAIEFLKSPGAVWESPARAPAHFALELADELITQAQARGWLKPLPEDNELNTPLRRHLERHVRAQVFSQVAGQRIGQEESPSVALPNGPLPNPGRRQ